MERLSRIYFSDKSAAAGAAPVALLTILNSAGPRGERAVESVRRILSREGIRSLIAGETGGGRYRLEGAGEEALMNGEALLGRLRAEENLDLFFLLLPVDTDDRGFRLFCRGDNSLLLVESEIPSLAAAYRALKRLNEDERGTMPAILSVSPRRNAWDGLAHRRLAEAADRFLHRRVPVWEAEGPDRTAARIADGFRHMRSRREGGMDPLLRRITPLIEEKD